MNVPYVPERAENISAVPFSPGRNALVRLDHVSRVYPARKNAADVAALKDVSLRVAPGEILAVIGRSGAGKSTLLRLINGLERPTSGRVVIDDADITALDERSLRPIRRSIGVIFQHFNLLSSRTALQNVALPLEIAGQSRAAASAAAEPLLDMVGLADKRGRYPAELSGGQKQRVGIARALATHPKLLLSDEATSALDPETTEQILTLLQRINRELNLTIILVTHEMAVAKAIASRIIVMGAGKIIEQGPTFDIFAKPKHTITKGFVASVTGANIPPWLADRLRPDGARLVLKLTVTGQASTQPLLAVIASQAGAKAEILYSQIDSIDGEAFGTIVIAVSGEAQAADALVHALLGRGIAAERIGHVA